jgi:hypothetical protein
METTNDSEHANKHVIKEWLTSCEAWTRGRDHHALCEALQGSVFLTAELVAPGTLDAETGLIRFTTPSPIKGERAKVRWMLPIHAAITRTLELAPGTLVRMQQGNRKQGKEKHYLSISIGKGRDKATTLTRILFNMPTAPRLWEKDGSNYRHIIPENYEMRSGIDRAAILAFIRDQGRSDIADLLADLFEIADREHQVAAASPAGDHEARRGVDI